MLHDLDGVASEEYYADFSFVAVDLPLPWLAVEFPFPTL